MPARLLAVPLAFLWLCLAGVACGQEAASEGILERPAITACRALEMAQEQAARAGLDLVGLYVSSISLDYDDGQRMHPDGIRRAHRQFWYVHWNRLKPSLGGGLSMRVYVNGEILVEKHGP